MAECACCCCDLFIGFLSSGVEFTLNKLDFLKQVYVQNEIDSTEHLFECNEYQSQEGNVDKVLQNEDMAALESALDNVMKRLQGFDLMLHS